MRRHSSGLRRFFPSPTRFVLGILIACVSIHVLILVLKSLNPELAIKIRTAGMLTPAGVLRQPWTIVTMAFLHSPSSIFHILFNMVALASIGPWLERALGTKRFALLYAIAMLCGSALFIGYGLLFGDPAMPALGASGAIMGIIVGFGFVFPEAELRLFGVAPFKAKNIIWIALGMDTIATVAGANIAVTVHVGGMLGAWLYLRRPWNPRYRMWAKARIKRQIDRIKAGSRSRNMDR